MGKVLSGTMVACIDASQDAGSLIRLMGGFWVAPGTGWNGQRPAGEYFGGATVQACVDRGELTYSEWKEGRCGRFPIEVRPHAVGRDTQMVEG